MPLKADLSTPKKTARKESLKSLMFYAADDSNSRNGAADGEAT